MPYDMRVIRDEGRMPMKKRTAKGRLIDFAGWRRALALRSRIGASVDPGMGGGWRGAAVLAAALLYAVFACAY